MTGATGNLGSLLSLELYRKNHLLKVVSRNKISALQNVLSPCEIIVKNAVNEELTAEDFEGVDVVIHLMGESIDGRWTSEKKKKILDSRIQSSANLLKNLPPTVQTVISASAQGIYPFSDEVIYSENSKFDLTDSFLQKVCQEWEKPFLEKSNQLKSTRFVQMRIGLVLDPQSGILKKLIPLFQKNLGAVLGNGQQWMSWISIEDCVKAFVHVLENPNIHGPVNLSTESPVRNVEWTKLLSEALGSWQGPAVPSLILKTVLGEMSELALGSIHMKPDVLIKSGFRFKFNHLKDYFTQHLEDFKNGNSVFETRQFIFKPRSQVFDFFSDAYNLEKITPKLLNFKILKVSTESLQTGTLIDYKLKVHGVPINWKTEILNWNPPFVFVDNQTMGPYQLWHHTHQFEETQFAAGTGTLMIDRVKYRLPMGFLGRLTAGSFVQSDVEKIFAFRREFIAENSF